MGGHFENGCHFAAIFVGSEMCNGPGAKKS
jgi:hypothetical protein